MHTVNPERKCGGWINLVLVIPFVVLLFAILVRILSHPDFIVSDGAVYLTGAQLILRGKMPYVDFVDILPPLMFYLSIPALWFASLAHLPITLAALLSMWLFIVFCLFTSVAVLWRHVKATDWEFLAPLLFGFCLLSLPLFFHFAQKEQIFVVAYMPFFLMRWLLLEGKQFNICLAMLVGAVTGIAVCLKPPQFLAFVAALEIYWCMKARRLVPGLKDPEVLACAATIFSLAFLFVICAPYSMRANFFFRWAPLTLIGYGAYHCYPIELFLFINSAGPILANYWSIISVCLIALFLRRQNSLFMPLLIWTAAGWLIYMVQQKGWAYHTIPMMSGYFTLANLELAVLAKWLIGRRFLAFPKSYVGGAVLAFMVYTTMLCVCLPWLVRDGVTTGATSGIMPAFKEAVLKYTRPGDPVLVVSTHLTPAYPTLIQTNRRPATRFMWTYPIRMYEYLKLHANSKKEKLLYEQDEERIVRELCEDAKRECPKLISISYDPMRFSGSFVLFSYLEAHGFKDILQDYYPVPTNNKYLLWIRRKSGT